MICDESFHHIKKIKYKYFKCLSIAKNSNIKKKTSYLRTHMLMFKIINGQILTLNKSPCL